MRHEKVEMVDRGTTHLDRHGTWRRFGSGPLPNSHPSWADRLFEHGGPTLAQNGGLGCSGRGHLRNLTKTRAGRWGNKPTVMISVLKAMRVFAFLVSLATLPSFALFAHGLLFALPAHAHSALPPGHAPGKYERWSYPNQISYGPLEEGTGNVHEAASPGAFMTLPSMGAHYITSIFDHCGPNYNVSGRICRYDGVVASARVGGPDPGFGAGYAQTPGLQDYLYYSGHDGYDYGLYYEPVAASAPMAGRAVAPSRTAGPWATCGSVARRGSHRSRCRPSRSPPPRRRTIHRRFTSSGRALPAPASPSTSSPRTASSTAGAAARATAPRRSRARSVRPTGSGQARLPAWAGRAAAART